MFLFYWNNLYASVIICTIDLNMTFIWLFRACLLWDWLMNLFYFKGISSIVLTNWVNLIWSININLSNFWCLALSSGGNNLVTIFWDYSIHILYLNKLSFITWINKLSSFMNLLFFSRIKVWILFNNRIRIQIMHFLFLYLVRWLNLKILFYSYF